ncbi:hypothetical protein M427DRAFT_378526 [Gonapodya prolifera JEL478]|uniref:Uncharacterized protein n=1 Tax=Gonapodya prolifera (strain JEL478) TaxID=1344416 RepID=A0A139AVR3_GONPJ|nr:hypothetical protein M427DRAFT_378526 [Gonapodya prolifera JEL478]|eukprot:KXS20565.1 hypothetical protein M427DRAFT_378526 [Gonapodya prolifera JEL478]
MASSATEEVPDNQSEAPSSTRELNEPPTPTPVATSSEGTPASVHRFSSELGTPMADGALAASSVALSEAALIQIPGDGTGLGSTSTAVPVSPSPAKPARRKMKWLVIGGVMAVVGLAVVAFGVSFLVIKTRDSSSSSSAAVVAGGTVANTTVSPTSAPHSTTSLTSSASATSKATTTTSSTTTRAPLSGPTMAPKGSPVTGEVFPDRATDFWFGLTVSDYLPPIMNNYSQGGFKPRLIHTYYSLVPQSDPQGLAEHFLVGAAGISPNGVMMISLEPFAGIEAVTEDVMRAHAQAFAYLNQWGYKVICALAHE